MKHTFSESFCFSICDFSRSGDGHAEVMIRSSSVLVLSAFVPRALPWAPTRQRSPMPGAGAAPLPSWLPSPGWVGGVSPGCQALLFHDPSCHRAPTPSCQTIKNETADHFPHFFSLCVNLT